MQAITKSDLWLNAALALLVLALMVVSLVVGRPGCRCEQPLRRCSVARDRAIIVREIRLPRTLLAMMIGATLGLSGAALQGLFRNPLAEPALFGAPQAAAATSSFAIAFGLFSATSLMASGSVSSAHWFPWARSC